MSPDIFGSAVYDAALGKVVMQGGRETWSWDGRNWAMITSADPSSALCFCLGYDSSHRQLLTLMQSGGKVLAATNHTLILEGTRWQVLAATTPIGIRMLLVDDPASSLLLILLVNQSTDGSSSSQAMWSWNGNSWTPVDVTLPPILVGASVGYDAASKRVVLFGGLDSYGSGVSDTWLWDGHTWQKAGH